MKAVELLFCSLTSELLVGVYEHGRLVRTITHSAHASEAIISVLDEMVAEYEISRIIYANTPGSFMGLKVAYVILQTFCKVKGCEFRAVSGFELSNDTPIRANKTMCFVRENGKISLAKCEPGEFKLPQNLDTLQLSDDVLPEYVIPAI